MVSDSYASSHVIKGLDVILESNILKQSIYYGGSYRGYKYCNGEVSGIFCVGSLSSLCCSFLGLLQMSLDLKKIASGRVLTEVKPIDFEYREKRKGSYVEIVDGNKYRYRNGSVGELGDIYNEKMKSIISGAPVKQSRLHLWTSDQSDGNYT